MDENKKIPPNELLNEYINMYLGANSSRQDEFEVRFGTKHYNTISKIDFDNIIEKLKSLQFKEEIVDGSYTLNIQNEYNDERTGKVKMSNIRTTISGLQNIQNYCKENNLDIENLPVGTIFMQKFPKRLGNARDSVTLKPIDFHDFHFRVKYSTERHLHTKKNEVIMLLENWKDSKKNFRFIKRFTFINEKFPFKIDCSIIKTSKKKRYFISEYNIQEADVFNNPENYEIEIELINELAKNYNSQDLLKLLKTVIKYVLSGWQQTNFPISYKNSDNILKEYLALIYGKENANNKRISTRNFIGPSSISLELKNIVAIHKDSNIPNINNPYTVTDKADGIRKLLFISKEGKIYFIDQNMNVQFTGSVTKNKKNFNSILDGEHILYDKKGNFINLYACFDIYFKNNKNLMIYPFISFDGIVYNSDNIEKDIFRWNEMNKFNNELNQECIISNYENCVKIKTKTFYSNIDSDIFKQCKKILDGVEDETMFEYETDGLIFTPCDKSVGSELVGEKLEPNKRTWNYSLKWKPSEFNTIDFLVTTKKDDNGEDFIGNIFEDGNNMASSSQVNQYKTLVLRVGFDERKHGFINPCEDILQENFPKYKDFSNDTYKPMPFQPTDPTPTYPIYLCNVMLKKLGKGKHLFTEDNKQVFEDNTIVEFKFKKNAKKFWQWIPIRVRYDKTSDYKKGRKNFGNAYHVAESVWKSIHHPVTPEMISTGENIPNVEDDNIYYNRTTQKTNTNALRDFHNKFVKRKLLLDISSRGNTLIDMTAGKGGDLPKWRDAKLSFVFGLDIAEDNITNRLDGICARYLKYRKTNRNIPRGLFIHANSSLNIKNGSACYSEKGKKIVDAIMGVGPKDETLGKGIYNAYGKGKEGFDIVSNQFSIHYFFENQETFYNFIRNVSENCKVGGYFIGTCYNGKKIFKELNSKKIKESLFILNENDKKVWEIKKQYDSNEFKDDSSSLGYKIDVYQESINKTFSEYLVNFNFLTRELENYGFVPLTNEELIAKGFANSVGSFSELFEIMKDEISKKRLKKQDIGDAINMTTDEKRISFLNNYFIYKKIRAPNARELTLNTLSKVSVQKEEEEGKEEIQIKRNVKKYKRKLKLPL